MGVDRDGVYVAGTTTLDREWLFSYLLNLKIDVVLKASRAVVIRRFSLNKGNNKITELRKILQRESQNS